MRYLEVTYHFMKCFSPYRFVITSKISNEFLGHIQLDEKKLASVTYKHINV